MMEKIQLWIRLGGYVTVDKDELINDDVDAIYNGLLRDGFELSGETYVPMDSACITDMEGNVIEEDELGLEEEINITYNPQKFKMTEVDTDD